MTHPENTSATARSAASKLGWLIVARLFTALVLFVIALLWNRTGDAQHTTAKSLVLISIVAGLTIIYFLILRLSQNILLQAKFQLAVDVVLVTWLVWNSDAIHSPYIALYIVIIAVSSLFLGP